MWRRALVALSLVGAAAAAPAADYRSVNVPAAILYDAPSLAGKKLYLIKAQTPVEIIVRLKAGSRYAMPRWRWRGSRRGILLTSELWW